MPGQTLLDNLRVQLETERASLERQLEELGAGDAGPSFDENFADSGQVAAEQGETRMLVASLSEQLRDTLRALGKIDSGDYGKCETCGQEISEARLEAMPAARYCINHA
jgi:RNA polymerase-binding transcription factor DksA